MLSISTLVDWGSSLSNNAAAWSSFRCFSPTLLFPPENKAFQMSQIPFCKAKFRPPHYSSCLPCRCLHEDINLQEGTSKGLLETRDRALQKSLGMDAGADARPPGTLRSPPRLVKHTAHLLLTRPHGFVSASVQNHKHWGTHLFSFSRHKSMSTLSWNISSFSFLRSSEHKINFTLISDLVL